MLLHAGGANHIGGDAPFGFRKLGSGRDAVLVPDETEQEHIRVAQEYRGPGKKWRMRAWDIANEMYKDGITNPRTGRAYSTASVWRLLQAPTRHYGGQNQMVKIVEENVIHG